MVMKAILWFLIPAITFGFLCPPCEENGANCPPKNRLKGEECGGDGYTPWIGRDGMVDRGDLV